MPMQAGLDDGGQLCIAEHLGEAVDVGLDVDLTTHPWRSTEVMAHL